MPSAYLVAQKFLDWQDDVNEYVERIAISQGLFIEGDPDAVQNDPTPEPPPEG